MQPLIQNSMDEPGIKICFGIADMLCTVFFIGIQSTVIRVAYGAFDSPADRADMTVLLIASAVYGCVAAYITYRLATTRNIHGLANRILLLVATEVALMLATPLILLLPFLIPIAVWVRHITGHDDPRRWKRGK